MNDVTAEEVRDACLAAKIEYIPHHECGGCGFEVSYVVRNGLLYFRPACDCSRRYTPDEPAHWEDAADWINMQNDEWKPKIAALFGIKAAHPNPGDTGGK